MKKLLSLLLALMLVAMPLMSCGGSDDADTTNADSGAAYDVESAAAFLKNMYKQYLTTPETAKDFTLVSQVMNNGVAYTVAWASNTEAVKVVADDAKKQVTIDVDEKTPEDINYELTATISDPAGKTANVVFKLLVPAYGASVSEGTIYKLYIMQGVAGKVLYLDGGISGGRYLTMTTDFASALDFNAEESGSGYKFYTTIDGAKKYIDTYLNDEGKAAIQYADSSECVYTYNSATYAWEVEIDGVAYYLGTYNNYETVSASKTSYITAENTRISQFPMELTTKEVEFEAVAPSDSDAVTTAPSEDPAPENPGVTTGTVVTAPVADKAYKFYLIQAKTGQVLYINGEVDGRYLTMTEDFSKAIDVFAEVVDGGYKFYTKIDGAKAYIEIYANDEGKTSVKYADSAECVYSYNTATYAWETTFNNTEYYLGTYNEFITVSASQTSYINADNTRTAQFPLELTTEAVTYEGADDKEETEAATTTGKVEAPEEDDKTVGTAASASDIKDGGKYVIYYAADTLVIGTEIAGKNSNQLAGVSAAVADGKISVTDKMAVFTVDYKEGDVFYLIVDGKYLTAGETGNSLTIESSASAYSEWVLETAENGWYIKNVNAKYNDNPQYLEYYYNFTTYGFNNTNTAIYTYNFYEVQ